MKRANRHILEQVIAATMEPIVVVGIDKPDWPVLFANPAFTSITNNTVVGQPFADVIERLSGRDLALEVSETIRSKEEASFPIESGNREYLLALKPLRNTRGSNVVFYAAYWRSNAGAGSAEGAELHHELLKAKRRIRDLSRDDAVTGLLNRQAFADVFEHDWAVAARENGKLSLVTFSLDDFAAYEDVFGRHATDSCLQRVGQAIRRCLRRASDVVARPGGDLFVVLSHSSDEEGVREFAKNIAIAVRELGLHHPRSQSSKFVTVSFGVHVADAAAETVDARHFLNDILSVVAE